MTKVVNIDRLQNTLTNQRICLRVPLLRQVFDIIVHLFEPRASQIVYESTRIKACTVET